MENINIVSKLCKKCNIEKDIFNFNKDKSKKDGYRNSCKACQKKYLSEYYSDNKDDINAKNGEWKKNNKEYLSEKSKNYYQENKESILIKRKEYIKNNKDINRERKRKYYKNNSKSILDKKKKYISKRKKQDKLFHLTLSIRSLIKNSFRKRNFSKSKTSEILGCSYEEFKSYIESKFIDGMSWDNYGDWHLDHKIPISWAKNECDVYTLNHHTNFQPMWAFDNMSKSNRFSSF